MKVKTAIKFLNENNPDENIIISWWTYDDLLNAGLISEMKSEEWESYCDKAEDNLSSSDFLERM